MKILFTVIFLDSFHGSVMHVKEHAEFLSSKKGGGHEVCIATLASTPDIVEFFSAAGLRTCLLHQLEIDTVWDVVFAYHWPTLDMLMGRGLTFRKLVLGSLSSYETMEAFPLYWKAASLRIVMSEETRNMHHSTYGIPLEDMQVFENSIPDSFANYALSRTLPEERPERIAVVSNHIPEELTEAARELSHTATVDFIGMGQRIYRNVTPELLAEYDLIISIGKTIQYAMGMGIPVFEYDRFGGIGYITPENMAAEAAYNFSGRPRQRRISAHQLAQEIKNGYASAKRDAPRLQTLSVERFLLSTKMERLLQDIEQAPAALPISEPLTFAHGQCLCNWLSHWKRTAWDYQARFVHADQQCQHQQNLLAQLDRSEKELRCKTEHFKPLCKCFLRYLKKKLGKIGKKINLSALKHTISSITPFKRPRGKERIIAIIAVQNEEKWLSGFFTHLRDYVDGFIVLDDGSTDSTPSIIRNESKVLKIFTNPPHGPEGWDEKGNRLRLIYEAQRHGDVILCCDADERFERRFLLSLRELAKKALQSPETAYGVHFRELWDTPTQYRCDGIWDEKRKFILFAACPNMTFDTTMPQKHHIQWYHDGIKNAVMLDFDLYHLKMIEKDERIKRAELYEKLDPEHKMQSIGYSYLTDEENIKLRTISNDAYELNTLC